MTSEIREKYLRILRAGLWNEPCAEEVTKEIFSIASGQATTGLICYNSQKKKYRKEYISLMMTNQDMDSLLAEVFTLLESKGIDCVLLKGQGCASYYSQPLLRNCGDIDIYVGEENYARACAILAGCNDNGDKGTESVKHMSLTYKGIPIEIHRIAEKMPTARMDKIFSEWALEGLTRGTVTIDVEGFPVRTPEDNFNALYIFYHLFHHFMLAGVGFRHVCDWTMFLHRKAGQLNLEQLEERLNALGLIQAWQAFGYISVNHLGLDPSEMPFYDERVARKAGKLIDMIFRSGNFGMLRKSVRKRPVNYWLAKAKSFLAHTQYFAESFTIFPRLSVLSYVGMLRRGIGQVLTDIKVGKA